MNDVGLVGNENVSNLHNTGFNVIGNLVSLEEFKAFSYFTIFLLSLKSIVRVSGVFVSKVLENFGEQLTFLTCRNVTCISKVESFFSNCFTIIVS